MIYDSPAQSPEISGLINYVSNSKEPNTPNIESVKQLLWLINVQPELRAFGLVCKNLINIFEIYEETGLASGKEYEYLKHWKTLCVWLHARESSLAQYVSEKISIRPKSPDDHPIKGRGFGRHCLYTVLCNTHANIDLREKYHYMIGLYLLAYSRSMVDFVPFDYFWSYSGTGHIKGFPNSPYNASFSLRDFSLVDIFFIRNLKLYESAGKFIGYCASHVAQLEDARGDALTIRRIKDYVYFVAKAFGIKDWIQRLRAARLRGKVGQVKRDVISGFLLLDDTYGQEDEEVRVSTLQPTIKSPRKAKNRGLHPDEATDDDESLVFIEVPCYRSKKGSGRTAFAALGYARHSAMRNQVLSWQQKQLTMTQLCRILKYCKEEFSELITLPKWDKDQLLKAELISLIHIMLWTSSSLERALSIDFQKDEELRGVLGLVFEDSSGKTPHWIMPAFKPDYATEVIEDDAYTCTRGNHILLPDVRRGSFFIIEIYRRKKTLNFTQKPSAYKKYLEDLLEEISPGVKISQLEKFLFNYLLNKTHDIALACEVTSRYHPLSGVRAFYTTVSLNKVQEEYADAITNISNAVYKELEASFVPREYIPVDHKDYAGARSRPKEDAVAVAVKEIQERIIRRNEKGITANEQLIEYHNYFTLYTILFFAYSTGCRDIVSPYIPLKEISIARGLGVLRDKDGREGNKGRIVWLPDSLIHQIGQYEKHCKSLLSTRSGLEKKVRKKGLDSFFLTEKNRCIPVSPKNIETLLEDILPLPANSNRKFMRMNLLENKCPQEVVEAFMGHWYYGEEYWGTFSSYNILEGIEVLKEYLVPIVEGRLGFKVIRSFLVSPV